MVDRLHFWCQKILPLVYDDSLSYYEVLCKVRVYLNNVVDEVNKLGSQVAVNTNDILEIKNKITEIDGEIEKIKSGEYIGNYIEALRDWIDNNFQCLITHMVKYVFFGLTDDGHFAAYVPRCWQFLNFCTPLDIKNCRYGHLILKW